MKTFAKFIAITVLCTLLNSFHPSSVQAQGSVNFQVFYDNLSPYGQWIDYPGYGYAWVPSEGSDFIPYSSGGHWVWTNYGWTWASDYNWGWAPFHYGRWDYNNYYGWVWIPDNVWGPAWVSWRRSSNYYGWAPLSSGISINMAIGGYNPPEDRWCFVQDHYMGRYDMHNYYGPRSYNQQYIRNSTVINNTYVDNRTHNTYIAGPGRDEVQKATGQKVRQFEIRENDQPGERLRKNEIALYRPAISRTNDNVRPEKVVTKNDDRTFGGGQRPLPERQPNHVNGVTNSTSTNTDNNRMPPRKFEEQQQQQQKEQQVRQQLLQQQRDLLQKQSEQTNPQLQQQKDEYLQRQQQERMMQQQEQQRNQELQQHRKQLEQQRNQELQQQRQQQEQQRNPERKQQVEPATQQAVPQQRQFSPHSKEPNKKDQL